MALCKTFVAATILCSIILLQVSQGFQPLATPAKTLVLQAGKSCRDYDVNAAKPASVTLASVVVAAAVVMATTTSAVSPVLALDTSYTTELPSHVLAAGRMSGGRMGGRSSFSAAPRYSRSTTIIRPMIAAPSPVIVSPGIGFGYSPFGYGYNPMGGFGLGYGLGAMQSAGDSIRDYRQESEIQQSKAELEQAKAREAELEQRIRALEQVQSSAPTN